MMRKLRVVPEAWILLIPLLLLAAAALLIQWYVAAIAFVTFAAIVAQLMRDPERTDTARTVDVIAPADGTIVALAHDGATHTIGIASSPFDVLVLRAPISSRLAETRNDEDGSQRIVLDGEGMRVEIVWRPGILSRRPELERRSGDRVARGERIGRLRFGSRVDLVVPVTAHPRVQSGERVKVGLSVVAEVN